MSPWCMTAAKQALGEGDEARASEVFQRCQSTWYYLAVSSRGSLNPFVLLQQPCVSSILGIQSQVGAQPWPP